MNNSICTLFDNILIDIHKFKSLLNINSMETTKTTEKFQSVHKTFSYTPKSALTNQWSSLAFGIGMVIVPLIYPFGLRIRRALHRQVLIIVVPF